MGTTATFVRFPISYSLSCLYISLANIDTAPDVGQDWPSILGAYGHEIRAALTVVIFANPNLLSLRKFHFATYFRKCSCIFRRVCSTSSFSSRADIRSTPLRKLDSCTRPSEEATRTA